MTIAWMLYTLLVTTLLFAGAAGAEFICRALRLPTRFVWIVAICASVGLSTHALVGGDPQPEPAVLSFVTLADASAGANGGEPGVTEPRGTTVTPPSIRGRLATLVLSALLAPGRRIGLLARSTPAGADLPILIGLAVTAVAGLTYLIAVAYRVRRTVGVLEPRELDGRRIFVSREFGPALLGILNPQIIIPRWVLSLSRRQRSVIVAHEKQHEDARDPVLLAVAGTAVALMPWNAPLWFAFARLRLAIEVDCDRRVLATHGDVRGYGDLLVTVYERATSSRLQPAFAAAPSNLEHRIRRLVAGSPTLLSTRGGLALIATLALAFVACETSAPTRTSGSTSRFVNQPAASVVGVVPRCISGGQRPAGMEWHDELRSLARQRRPEAFAAARNDERIVALVLDENCAVQQDTVIVSTDEKRGDLAFPFFAKALGDSARRRVGMAWDLRQKLTIAYAIRPSSAWTARTESTPCGIGVRFDEYCGLQGPLEIRKIDSVHALVAVRGFNAPNQPANELFLITLAHPTTALATQSMAHGVLAYQSGALYVEDFLAREPLLWIGTPTSSGLETSKRKRDVQVIDQLIGIAHYTGHPLTLEQVAQLKPAAKCDGPVGSCYEAAGTEIRFP